MSYDNRSFSESDFVESRPTLDPTLVSRIDPSSWICVLLDAWKKFQKNHMDAQIWWWVFIHGAKSDDHKSVSQKNTSPFYHNQNPSLWVNFKPKTPKELYASNCFLHSSHLALVSSSSGTKQENKNG